MSVACWRPGRSHRAAALAAMAVLLVAGCTAGAPARTGRSSAPAPASVASSPTEPVTAASPSAPPLSSSSGPASTSPPVEASGAIEPNHRLTPGEAFPAATAGQVCVPGYSASVRDVPQATRLAVFAAYGVPYANHAAYELDHLISLELGGDNAAANLWPEPLASAGGAHVKDGLENRLHSLVCAGRISLGEAQRAIAGDWWAAEQKYGSDSGPQVPAPVAPAAAPAPAPASGTYYANCSAARAAGAAPLRRGQPGYRSGLDRDGDGVACE
jgi:hypothetical protein